MYRFAIEELKKWKARENRKPLSTLGARQVGKTLLMKEFGSSSYEQTVYINFDSNTQMQRLFDGDLDVQRIIIGLELYIGYKIDPEKMLLVFDEIQEVPKALTSLKYFNENAPQYQIVCAGSLLGIALHDGTSFPVGKVEFLDLYPLSFYEFLTALGKGRFVTLLKDQEYSTASNFRQVYIDSLKQYYYIGGMPEVVQAFVDNKDFNEARTIQQRILSAYEQDFSKHAPNEAVPRIRMIWNSIPSQLAKENKKFIYGLIKEGARAKDYELALLWLSDCGLVHKVNRVTVPNLPLKAYEDLRAFKLFFVDIGLLSCLAGLRQNVLLDGNELFKEFKGALTEQYVLQELKTRKGIQCYYWTAERGTAEVDFVVDDGADVFPIEVKAEINLQAKSLKVFHEKYRPAKSIRTSMADYKDEGWLINLPLWAVENI